MKKCKMKWYNIKFIPKNNISADAWIKVYQALVKWRQTNELGESLNICEHHHITPRCWKRENNHTTVKLTLGEHMLAHFYLMNYAYRRFGVHSNAFMRSYCAFIAIYGRSPFNKSKYDDLKNFYVYEANVRRHFMGVGI